jgi:pilus assembly protein CpaC
MRLRALQYITTVSLAALFISVGTAFGGIPTQVPVNKSILLNLKNPAVRVSIASPEIAEFLLLSPRQIQLNGMKIGSTNLIVWEKGGVKPIFFDVAVINGNINEMLREMAPNDDITADFINDTVILKGTAKNEDTVNKAIAIAGAFAPQSDIKISVSEENGIKVTKTELSSRVVNQIVIDQPTQVVLQVKVAQVDKTSLKKLGISGIIKGQTAEGFMNLIGAPTGSAVAPTTSAIVGGSSVLTQSPAVGTGIAGNVLGLGAFNPLDVFQFGVSYFPAGIGAVIQALATKGLAKVLAEPNLLVRSGGTGVFNAGSEIPYSVLQTSGGQSTSSIIFKKVGISLIFSPEIMENGLINLKIPMAEVSGISGTLAVNGYPIIDTRNVSTSVVLRDGESLILAGLLSEETISTMSKIPILGDIPILGALFRSTQKDIKEKELVFFITPKLMRPTAQGVKTELPTDRHPTEQEEKELRWVPIP